jgi:ethanolamine ammonia-lyase small subunit
MALEDNIKLIVEQVLNQINEKNKETAQAPVQKEKKTACPAGTDEAILDDITQVDLQKYLQVPNPVNGDFYREMKKATPARIGVWRAGTRPLTDTLLRFRAIMLQLRMRYSMMFPKNLFRILIW